MGAHWDVCQRPKREIGAPETTREQQLMKNHVNPVRGPTQVDACFGESMTIFAFDGLGSSYLARGSRASDIARTPELPIICIGRPIK